ncbi:hypothetical protein SDC9_202549 [bioreactor metagenome]|uniref:Uncharacterized protein n=1 Tax=bioreactor metagenome TaxID=1076179 RepID=A0A645ITZ2_9ZZZZ
MKAEVVRVYYDAALGVDRAGDADADRTGAKAVDERGDFLHERIALLGGNTRAAQHRASIGEQRLNACAAYVDAQIHHSSSWWLCESSSQRRSNSLAAS